MKALFESIGVAAAEFDGAIDSFAVTGLVSQYDHNTEGFNIRGVPSTLVNGKYLIKTESLKSADEFKSFDPVFAGPKRVTVDGWYMQGSFGSPFF